MTNPLRSEAAAYRFLLGTVAYFGAIVIATTAGGRWWGLGVFVVATAAVAHRLFRREARGRPAPAAQPPRGEGARRILVLVDETDSGTKLSDQIKAAGGGGGDASVLVVASVATSSLKRWMSDGDDAREGAEEHLQSMIAGLKGLGIEATGEVGDADPLQAIDDALRTFGADVIIIATRPERGVAAAARERFALRVVEF